MELDMTNLPERFWAKTRLEDHGFRTPCLTWTAYKMPNGYGRFGFEGKPRYVHRVAYEQLVGAIPDGMMIDHLCRNRACVNVDHLEVVTNRVNILRGKTVTAANASKTHCVRGHLFDEENTRHNPRTGNRSCRTCQRLHRAKRTEAARRARVSSPTPRRTHCKRGHELTDDNIVPSKPGWLICRTCAQENNRRYKERKRATAHRRPPHRRRADRRVSILASYGQPETTGTENTP